MADFQFKMKGLQMAFKYFSPTLIMGPRSVGSIRWELVFPFVKKIFEISLFDKMYNTKCMVEVKSMVQQLA